MKIFPPALEIDSLEGFDPAKDIFKRAPLGAGLTHFFGTVTEPTVVALDARWGSGKTTFLKMWSGELRNAGFPVVVFDAFENDYFDDAFIAIAGEIIAMAESRRMANQPAAEKFIAKATSVGKILAKGGGHIALKVATLGAVGAGDVGNIGKEVIKEIGDQATALYEKHIGELLSQQREQKDAIAKFREALSELPALLSNGTPSSAEAPQRPLIFIIDELDRCRPQFALQILERIKHFFSVENVHFVFATHLGQLKNSVAVAYGAKIETSAYLQKFIHLVVPLLDTPDQVRQGATSVFIDYLVSAMELQGEGMESVTLSIKHVARHRELTFRDIERILSCVALSFAFATRKEMRPPLILAGLCILKATDHELFTKAKLGKLHYQEVVGFLALATPSDTGFNVERMAAYWKYCLGQPLADQDKAGMIEMFSRFHVVPADIVPMVANRIVDRLSPISE